MFFGQKNNLFHPTVNKLHVVLNTISKFFYKGGKAQTANKLVNSVFFTFLNETKKKTSLPVTRTSVDIFQKLFRSFYKLKPVIRFVYRFINNRHKRVPKAAFLEQQFRKLFLNFSSLTRRSRQVSHEVLLKELFLVYSKANQSALLQKRDAIHKKGYEARTLIRKSKLPFVSKKIVIGTMSKFDKKSKSYVTVKQFGVMPPQEHLEKRLRLYYERKRYYWLALNFKQRAEINAFKLLNHNRWRKKFKNYFVKFRLNENF